MTRPGIETRSPGSLANTTNLASHNLTRHLFAHSFFLFDSLIGLSGATTLNQSGPESSGNEGVICITQISNVGVSSSDGLMSYPERFLEVGVLPLQRDAVGVFHSPS